MKKQERQELPSNEFYISRDDLNLEVLVGEKSDVYVKITGFEDNEEAGDYADYLAETLPLLLFETTTIQ